MCARCVRHTYEASHHLPQAGWGPIVATASSRPRARPEAPAPAARERAACTPLAPTVGAPALESRTSACRGCRPVFSPERAGGSGCVANRARYCMPSGCSDGAEPNCPTGKGAWLVASTSGPSVHNSRAPQWRQQASGRSQSRFQRDNN